MWEFDLHVFFLGGIVAKLMKGDSLKTTYTWLNFRDQL